MSSNYSSGNISSPFRVKNLKRFKAWCADVGLLIEDDGIDSVVIQPNDDGEWEMTELDDAGGWVDFKVELGKVLGEWMLPGQVVVLYCSWHNSKHSTTSAGGDVTIIGSDGVARTVALTDVASAIAAQYYPGSVALTSGTDGQPIPAVVSLPVAEVTLSGLDKRLDTLEHMLSHLTQQYVPCTDREGETPYKCAHHPKYPWRDHLCPEHASRIGAPHRDIHLATKNLPIA